MDPPSDCFVNEQLMAWVGCRDFDAHVKLRHGLYHEFDPCDVQPWPKVCLANPLNAHARLKAAAMASPSHFVPTFPNSSFWSRRRVELSQVLKNAGSSIPNSSTSSSSGLNSSNSPKSMMCTQDVDSRLALGIFTLSASLSRSR